MLRVLLIVGTVLVCGCPSTRPQAPAVVDDSALRIRIAHLEVRRGDGVAELIALAQDRDVHTRELALRGLGRSGDAKAYAVLEQALADPEPRVVAAAAAAIGVAASLDDKAMSSAALVRALPTQRDVRTTLVLIEAIGRAGEADAQDALVALIADRVTHKTTWMWEPEVADEMTEQVALALGRFGRRKLKLDDASRAFLVGATRHVTASVRYAAIYALGREFEPTQDADVIAALVANVVDTDPETRAQAIAGLARRKKIAAVQPRIVEALHDRDWRVAVETVRALGGDAGDAQGRAAILTMIKGLDASRPMPQLTEGVAIEALRTLLAYPVPVPEGTSIIASGATGWIGCLTIAVFHAPTAATVDAVASCKLPDHLKLPLLVELFDRADVGYRRAALRVLLSHDDPRVRAAGIGALPKTWKDGDDKAHATIVGTIASALAVKDPIISGTAVDAAEQLYDAMGEGNPLQATLDNALVARATIEPDVELSQSLYTLIGKRKITSGAEACRGGIDAPPAAAKAALECLRALGEAVVNPPPPRVDPPPPVRVEDVIGKRVRWHLETSRGPIVIDLRPDVAPWAVATIVTLTRRGFYDGIEFHRVVPDFVVQGGDPTMSGAGGPGFTLPAEPNSFLDDWQNSRGYVEGGVGMADAGRDSAGSQWFIMHSRAPHLDGRYTWVGSVISGQNTADALQIGDRVIKGTIELGPVSR